MSQNKRSQSREAWRKNIIRRNSGNTQFRIHRICWMLKIIHLIDKEKSEVSPAFPLLEPHEITLNMSIIRSKLCTYSVQWVVPFKKPTLKCPGNCWKRGSRTQRSRGNNMVTIETRKIEMITLKSIMLKSRACWEMKLVNNAVHGGGGVSEGELVKGLSCSAKKIMAVKLKGPMG